MFVYTLSNMSKGISSLSCKRNNESSQRNKQCWLWYPKGIVCNLVGFSNSDYAGCKADKKRTSGIYHILGNALVSWSCKKQACIALNTAET